MILTESQLKNILESLNLKSPFKNLPVGTIIVAKTKHKKTGEEYELKFKVVEDLGDSIRLENINQNSTFTGFNWIVKKDEDVSDSDIKATIASKNTPDNKKSYTLKRISDMDVESASDVDGEDDAPVGDEDDLEQCVIDMEPKGHVEKYPACYKDRVIQEELDELRDTIKEGKGFFFEISESKKLVFNVLEKTDKLAKMELAEVGDSKYNDLKGGKFSILFKSGTIEPSDTEEFYRNFNIISAVGGKVETIEDVSDYGLSELDEDDTPKGVDGISDGLKKLIDENENFKLTLGDSSTMTFNVVDKKEAKVLGKESTLKSATIKLVDTDNEEYSKRVGVQLVIDFSKPDDIIKLNGGAFDLLLKGKQAKKPFLLKNIKKYEPTSFTEVEDKVEEESEEDLLNRINSDPRLKKFFVDRPKLLGFIEGADYTGLSRVYGILRKKGFIEDGDSKGNIKTDFSNNKKVSFIFEKDVNLGTKPGSSEPQLKLDGKVENVAKIRKIKGKVSFIYNHKIDDKNDIDVKLELIDEGEDKIFTAKVYTDAHIAKKVKIKVDKVNFI